MFFLPWEKWLPRWLHGPIHCAVAVIGVVASHDQLGWFGWLGAAFLFFVGLLLTYAWFIDRRNNIN